MAEMSSAVWRRAALARAVSPRASFMSTFEIALTSNKIAQNYVFHPVYGFDWSSFKLK